MDHTNTYNGINCGIPSGRKNAIEDISTNYFGFA
jgi:hypothetical protein